MILNCCYKGIFNYQFSSQVKCPSLKELISRYSFLISGYIVTTLRTANYKLKNDKCVLFNVVLTVSY